MNKIEWIRCPVCGNKTRLQIRVRYMRIKWLVLTVLFFTLISIIGIWIGVYLLGYSMPEMVYIHAIIQNPLITLFDQTGADMDKACLAESLFAPTVLLQDYITFEEISDFEVRATISYKGQTASGIFTFNEQYEMISFTTNDRAVAGTDGSMEYVPWSALCGEYQFSDNGIKYPTKFQAVWNYPDGDFVYFDGVISEVSYGYKQ